MWEIIAALAGVSAVVVTTVGLGLVIRQISDGRRAIKAQFISKLESEITSLYDVYNKLLPGEVWFSTESGPQNREEISKIIPYLGFFTKIKFLLDLGALDLKTVDRMFVFRFFVIANNLHVQKKILYSDLYENYWSEIFALHYEWVKCRKLRDLKIPFEETSLEKYDSERYLQLARESEDKNRYARLKAWVKRKTS